MANQNKNQDLAQRQKTHRARAFRIAFEMIFIFGVPAFVAFLFGGWLDTRFETGGRILQIISLAVAFVVSWAIVFWRVHAISKDWNNIKDEMRQRDDKVDSVARAGTDKETDRKDH